MNAAGDQEREWIRLSRSGDALAFDRLVERYQDRIFGLIRRQIPEFELAEELTQDVFIKAYRALDRFRGESAFGTWLYRIAVNQVRDYCRGREAHGEAQKVAIEDEFGSEAALPSHHRAPDLAVADSEVIAAFARALGGLGPELREVFLLRHQEGLGYDELATALDISRTNAKVRVHRARERVLEAMRRDGYDV